MTGPAAVAVKNEVPDLLPNLGGKLPETWNVLIDDLGQVEPDSRRRQELEARLRVWCLFAELRANQVEAEATLAQATALKKATWVLAIATFILVIATIAAAIIVVAAG